MPTKFSQFNNGGALAPGDILAGLRNGTNTIFNASAVLGSNWVTILASQSLIADTNYFTANAVPAVYTLPTVFPFGQSIFIANIGPSTFTIAQNAGQLIIMGNQITTVGVGGSLACTQTGDGLYLYCYQANTGFIVVGAPQGIWVVT